MLRTSVLVDRYIFIPLLYSVYPISYLLARNLSELSIGDAIRSLLISTAVTLICSIVFNLLLRSTKKSAIITSLAAAAFFSYGHLYESLRSHNILGIMVGRHRFLMVLFLILLLAAILVSNRIKDIPQEAIRIFAIGGLVLLVMPTLQIVRYVIVSYSAPSEDVMQVEPQVTYELKSGDPPRDVYLIILDSYTRDDVLLETFDYDNTMFISSMESLGFKVARESRSNYAVSRLSIPSTLNMEYIDSLGYPIQPDDKDSRWLDKVGRYSKVRESFEALGYKIVSFESAYGLTNWIDSDLYLSPKPILMSDAVAFGSMNTFEQLLLQTTMARIVIDLRIKIKDYLGVDIPDPNQQHRERILFALDRLGRLHEISGPKFVFMHIMSPHAPYIFNADGGIAEVEGIFSLADGVTSLPDISEEEAYRNQIQYLNLRILEEVDSLLRASKPEPIIVIMGDHGALHVTNEDRMKIFYAIYLPETEAKGFYNQISPVNTFRLIFNQYFGGEFPLLDDISYYSDIERPLDFHLIH